MRAILLSNIPHYNYLASALHRTNYLTKFITSVTLLEDEKVPGFLPAFWQNKLEGRRLRGIPAEKVERIRTPELLQRGLPRLRLTSNERATWLNNHMFDLMAKKFVQDCDVFHFVSSVGLHAARKAKSMGAIIVCDVRQIHPKVQNIIIAEEGEKYGIKSTQKGMSYENKVLEEFSIADYFIVPSSYAKATFVDKGFDENIISVLPYGIDLQDFSRIDRSDSTFRVLFVGQISLHKGVQYLLQAFKELDLPGSELLLIGQIDPPFEPLLKTYEEYFRHIPSVPKVELFKYYSNSSVFVLPSLVDAFSLVTLEAMSCGLPVIVTDNTGAKEVVRQGLDGFVVPIKNVETLKQRILYLYEHPESCRQMGEAAEQRAKDVTWERYEQQAIEVYEAIDAKHN